MELGIESLSSSRSKNGRLITELAKMGKKPSLEAPLSDVLEEFLQKLRESDDYMLQGIVCTNFAEAALFLQSSAEVYCKKVDLLWDAILNYQQRIQQCVKSKENDEELQAEALILEERRNKYKRRRKENDAQKNPKETGLVGDTLLNELVSEDFMIPTDNILMDKWFNSPKLTYHPKKPLEINELMETIDCLHHDIFDENEELVVSYNKLYSSTTIEKMFLILRHFNIPQSNDMFSIYSDYYLLGKYMAEKGMNSKDLKASNEEYKLFLQRHRDNLVSAQHKEQAQRRSRLQNFNSKLSNEDINRIFVHPSFVRLERLSVDTLGSTKKKLHFEENTPLEKSFDRDSAFGDVESGVGDLDSSFEEMESINHSGSDPENTERSKDLAQSLDENPTPSTVENTPIEPNKDPPDVKTVSETIQSEVQPENVPQVLNTTPQEVLPAPRPRTKRQKDLDAKKEQKRKLQHENKLDQQMNKRLRTSKQILVPRCYKMGPNWGLNIEPAGSFEYEDPDSIIVTKVVYEKEEMATVPLKKVAKKLKTKKGAEENKENHENIEEVKTTESPENDSALDFTIDPDDINHSDDSSEPNNDIAAGPSTPRSNKVISPLCTSTPSCSQDSGIESSSSIFDDATPSTSFSEDFNQPGTSMTNDDYLSTYHQMESSLAGNVMEWRRFITVKLRNLQNKSDFDIHEYGGRILDTGSIGDTIKFGKMMQGKASSEVARYFISALQLANTGNVGIEGAQKGKLSNDTFQIKMLKKERYHEQLGEYQAPSEETYSDRLSKAKCAVKRKSNSAPEGNCSQKLSCKGNEKH